MLHTDIPSGDWIDRFLPAALRPYARLMRLDRPIGTWLLFWPCVWGTLLVAKTEEPVPFDLLFLFALGSIVMRGAGCVINDLWDRRLDQMVERTQLRPLASGVLSVKQAGALLAVLLGSGLGVLLQLNALSICLGLSSMAIVVVYPLAKRVTYWPQLVLGFAFNWGALLGGTAVAGKLTWPSVALYAAGVFWTLGYDTIYAHQDKKDDVLAGVKSLALYLGRYSRLGIAVFYTLFLGLVAVAGAGVALGPGFEVGIACATCHAIWQFAGWHPDDPADCLKRFRSNRDMGFFICLAIVLGKLS